MLSTINNGSYDSSSININHSELFNEEQLYSNSTNRLMFTTNGTGHRVYQVSAKPIGYVIGEQLRNAFDAIVDTVNVLYTRFIQRTPSGKIAPIKSANLLKEKKKAQVQNITRFCLSQIGSYTNVSEARQVVLSGHYAFVVDYPVKVQILDISNSSKPVYVSEIPNPGGFTTGVALLNDFAFTLHEAAGMLISNVSNKYNPINISLYDTPGYAIRAALTEDYAYVPDWWSGFQVVDIRNRRTPSRVRWIQPGGNFQGVFLERNYTYFVAKESPYLWIYDVTDPPNPIFTARYNITQLYGVAYGWEVIVRYEVAFLAASTHLEIIDVRNKTNPSYLSSFSLGGVRGVCFWNEYVVVGAARGVYIFDVSNTSNPLLVAAENNTASWEIVAANNTIYAPSFNLGLRIISITNCSELTSSTTSRTTSSISSSTVSSTTTTSSSTKETHSLNTTNFEFSDVTLSSSSVEEITTLSSNKRIVWILLGVGTSGLICMGVGGVILFYRIKQRNLSGKQVTIFADDYPLALSSGPMTDNYKDDKDTSNHETSIETQEDQYQKTPAFVTSLENQDDQYQRTPAFVTSLGPKDDQHQFE